MNVFGEPHLSARADGTCVRDYIHVSDLVQAHLDALRYLRKGGASVTANCGYGRGYSVREVIDTVQAGLGVDFRVDLGPQRAGRSGADRRLVRRARAVLGWKPARDDLPTIVRHALGWERKLMLRQSVISMC